MFLDLDSIRAAHERIRLYINHTPVLTSSRLDDASGASLFFKCENFQKVGAFKARGATNAVFSLDDATAMCGVATHSSGNHGAALARAAKLRGILAHIVMPSNSAKVKVRGVEAYGAHIVFCEPTEAARESACEDVIAKTGATLIHSFENEDVIAGQGTAAVELLEGGFRSRPCDVSGRRRWFALRHGGRGKIDAAKNPGDRGRAGERGRCGTIVSRRTIDPHQKEIHHRRRATDKCWHAKFCDHRALRGRHCDGERRSDYLSHAHDLGDDENRHRTVSGRSVCGNLGIKDRHRRKTRGRHSHRRQCGSRRVAVDVDQRLGSEIEGEGRGDKGACQ